MTNVPVIYIRLVNRILREFLDVFVIVYLDNILIYSQNKKEYIGYILAVLEALDSAELRLKPEKYKFYIKETVFLGYIISEHRIAIDSKKIELVKK